MQVHAFAAKHAFVNGVIFIAFYQQSSIALPAYNNAATHTTVAACSADFRWMMIMFPVIQALLCFYYKYFINLSTVLLFNIVASHYVHRFVLSSARVMHLHSPMHHSFKVPIKLYSGGCKRGIAGFCFGSFFSSESCYQYNTRNSHYNKADISKCLYISNVLALEKKAE